MGIWTKAALFAVVVLVGIVFAAPVQATRIDFSMPDAELRFDPHQDEFLNIDYVTFEANNQLDPFSSLISVTSGGETANFHRYWWADDSIARVTMIRQGDNDWTGTGTFMLWDITDALVVEAVFTSTEISLTDGTLLTVSGTLSPASGDSILLGHDDTWTYEGEDHTLVVPGMSQVSSATVVMQMTVPELENATLDDVLTFSSYVNIGTLEGTAGVPEPATCCLLLVGAGAMLARRRK